MAELMIKEETREPEAVLQVDSLVQRVGRETVLKGVTFQVYPGECFGLFGCSGSGKTTLLHVLAGIDRFVSGRVMLLGYDVKKSEAFKKRVGLVTQERSLFQDLSAAENLDFIAALKNADKSQIVRLVAELELDSYLREPVSLLRRGPYQRLSLACALLNRPELLLVDELIEDCDLPSRQILARKLKEFVSEGGSCVYATGSVEHLDLMDRVGWLEDGALSIYKPEQLLEVRRQRLDELEEAGSEAGSGKRSGEQDA